MTKEQMEYMADRFLGWRFPDDFNPDGGISYVRPGYADHLNINPVGTNLLTAVQAREMVKYMVEGMPEAK